MALWRWKLLSTAAISQIFCSDLAPSSAYNRILNLRAKGFITTASTKPKEVDRHFVWTLTSKGFSEIREPELRYLSEVGFRSETPEHDYLVSAIHLGAWLKNLPPNCALYSEQELRRWRKDQHPKWVPHMPDHRPDGYWHIFKMNKPGTVALEVELSQKYQTDYRATVVLYDRLESLHRVVWVVRYKGIAELVHSESLSISSRNTPNFVFFYEKEVETLGWNAKAFLGRDVGQTLADVLGTKVTPMEHVTSMSLFDSRKCPHRSPSYADQPKTLISHRVYPSILGTRSSFPDPNSNKGEHTNE